MWYLGFRKVYCSHCHVGGERNQWWGFGGGGNRCCSNFYVTLYSFFSWITHFFHSFNNSFNRPAKIFIQRIYSFKKDPKLSIQRIHSFKKDPKLFIQRIYSFKKSKIIHLKKIVIQVKNGLWPTATRSSLGWQQRYTCKHFLTSNSNSFHIFLSLIYLIF